MAAAATEQVGRAQVRLIDASVLSPTVLRADRASQITKRAKPVLRSPCLDVWPYHRENGDVKRLYSVAIGVMAALLVLSGCAQECLDDPIEPSFDTSEVSGEVLRSEVLVDEWSTNINLITMRTAGGDVEFELTGRTDLIEVGERYSATLYVDSENPNSTGTGTAALFGPNGCGGFKNTILALDADGDTSPVEIPSAIPDSPITLRQYLLGFGIFAAVLFVFRHR